MFFSLLFSDEFEDTVLLLLFAYVPSFIKLEKTPSGSALVPGFPAGYFIRANI